MRGRKNYPRVPASRTSPRQARTGAAAAPRQPAALEALEGRRLLSAVLFSEGVLTLTGDQDRNNILRVDYNGGQNLTAIANGVYRTVPRNLVASVRITGGGGIDRIRVSKALTAPTLIVAGPGNDIVYGGAGADLIYGGDGNDRLTGRAGKDKLVGGTGYDTLTGTR